MQQKHGQIKELGATLISISPMLKIISADLVRKHGLDFPVLSDIGNDIAKKYGLVFTLAESLSPIYSGFGIDLKKSNGDSTNQLPIPATFVVDRSGIIRYCFADVDHTARLDPEKLLKELKKI